MGSLTWTEKARLLLPQPNMVFPLFWCIFCGSKSREVVAGFLAPFSPLVNRNIYMNTMKGAKALEHPMSVPF
jgi:hypothetical protein